MSPTFTSLRKNLLCKMTQKLILLAFIFASTVNAFAQKNDSIHSKKRVYILPIKMEIGSTSWVHTQEAFKEAEEMEASCIIIHMNTYGGQVVFADSMRTKILNSRIPVHVFIDNNAASAGALISIACDSIYMRPGANIGAATVVNQSGEKMMDKYQSYMRGTIRSTAETHGKDTIITANDTIYKWRRDPDIAQAMVDERIYIPGIVDSTQILTFTTQEAITNNYCEGTANNISEVIKLLKIDHYTLHQYKPTFYDGLKGLLTSPVLQGILILIIIGGLYFELQSPGIGFPLMASIFAAIIYFAPLYIDGLAANWEILLFIIGLILIALEVFVIPGFGVTGISGITLVITGLTLSLLNNVVFDFSNVRSDAITEAFLVVITSIFASFLLAILITSKLASSGPLSKLSLQTSQKISDGFLAVELEPIKLIGQRAITQTILRPSGKIELEGEVYDAISEEGFINKGEKVEITGYQSGQLNVIKHIE